MNPEQFWRDVSESSSPPVILPDIGTFFNRDMQQADQLMHEVARSGTHYIKGEILHDAEICLSTDIAEHYLGADATPVSENYRSLIERKTVSLDDYRKLFSACEKHRIGLVLSVYDLQGVDFAIEIGACALKIASTNIVHAPLIRACAATGLPLLIDSGKSTLAEVERALQWAKDAGSEKIVIEYSPPAPPTPLANHNLLVMQELVKRFELPIGLSDHHHGEEMLYAATVLGCRVLEKGVCPTQNANDQDVYHALPIDHLSRVRQRCHNIHTAMGNAHAAYQPPEQRPVARMGLVTQQTLKPGDIINLNSVRFAFPTIGIPVEQWDEVEGSTVSQTLDANTPLEWSHVRS